MDSDLPKFPSLSALLWAAAEQYQREAPTASREAVLAKAELVFKRALAELGLHEEYMRRVTRGH